VIQWYLEQLAFPQHMRFQNQQSSSRRQELGAHVLFQKRIELSGTPTELLPADLGRCHFAAGDDTAMFTTLTEPKIMSIRQVQWNWAVKSLPEGVVTEEVVLIDTGTLITGMSNLEVAPFLAGRKSFKKQGVVYLDSKDAKMVLVKKTKSSMKIEDCGILVEERFAFCDQGSRHMMQAQSMLAPFPAKT